MKPLSRAGSPLMRTMLRAGQEEMPSPSLVAGTYRALGVTTGLVGVVGTSLTAQAATKVGLGAAIKWAGVGVIAGLAAAAGAVQLSRMQASAPAPVAAPVVATPPVASALAPVVVMRAPSPVRPVQQTHPAPSSAPESPSSTLAAEARLLEAARQALRDGNVEQARQALDRHDRDFPGKALGCEAAYLRMEAFERQGNREAAIAAAEQLLREHPDSPHAARARSVAGQ